MIDKNNFENLIQLYKLKMSVFDYNYKPSNPIVFNLKTDESLLRRFYEQYQLFSASNPESTTIENHIFENDCLYLNMKNAFRVCIGQVKYYVLNDFQQTYIMIEKDGAFMSGCLLFSGTIVYHRHFEVLIQQNTIDYMLLNLNSVEGEVKYTEYFNYRHFDGILYNPRQIIILNSVFESLIKVPRDCHPQKLAPNIQKVHFNDCVEEIDVNLFGSTLFSEMLDNGEIYLMTDSEVLRDPKSGIKFLDYVMATNRLIYEKYYLMLIHSELSKNDYSSVDEKKLSV